MGGPNSGRKPNMENIFTKKGDDVQFSEGQKSKGILDDFAERKNIDTAEGTVEKVPVNAKDIVNKEYADALSGAVEGTAVLSTGEGGATKFLREDGDGTSSWQTAAGAGDVTAAVNLTDETIVQGDGGAKGVKTSTATVAQVAANVAHAATTTGNPHVVLLDELGDPSGNKSFTMANKTLAFRYTAPTPTGAFQGAFEIEATGGFTGNLFHIHQHTGTVGAVNLIGVEAEDSDVTVMNLSGAGTWDLNTVQGIQSQSNISGANFTSGATVLYYTDAQIDHTGIGNIGTNTHAQLDSVAANYATTSAAYNTHAADSSDPHGAVLTQTNIDSSGTISGANMVMTADNDASGAAILRNVLIGTEASPGAASNWTQGTVYLQYTA